MNKKYIRDLGTLIPSSMMLLISMLSFTNPFDKVFGFTEVDMKGLFILGLVLIFPILFAIEGIVSAIKNIVWIIPLSISLMVFFVIKLVALNDSANIYLMYYFIAYMLGYCISKLVLKLKNLYIQK